MQYQPGHRNPGPGRPKGSVSGRARALQVLDELLSQDDNQEQLRAALDSLFKRDPVRFFRNIVMPLLPRHAVMTMESITPEPVRWVSLLESHPVDRPPSEREIPAGISSTGLISDKTEG